jgi:chorismate--pyruvate lyase
MSAPAHSPALRSLSWTEATQVAAAVRPGALWSWLTDEGSLTQRLRARAGEGFALQVLAESYEPLRRSDAQRMGVPFPQDALIREVRLDADGRGAIHAVTVIPQSTIAAHPALAELGGRPLGEALFNPKDGAELDGEVAQREPFEVACLEPDHALAERALIALGEPREQLWARRSVVRLGDEPLLIHECFVADWEW